MLEAIAVVRDLVIILSAIIMTAVVVLVGRVFLRLTRKAEEMQAFVGNVVTGVFNPIKGALLLLSRRRRT